MKIFSSILDLACYLPEEILDNNTLASIFPSWPAEKIFNKTGIKRRRIAGKNETAGDMAYQAALNLFSQGKVKPSQIDFIIFCTQSPDYLLPTTACILQEKLQIPQASGAIDINLGCSGYIYALSLADGLIQSGSANVILLLTADTYTKYINPLDKSVRTLFGDAATATVVSKSTSLSQNIGPFVFGTDGSGKENLIVKSGGCRLAKSSKTSIEKRDVFDNVRSIDNLYMDGPEIMNFTLREVPKILQKLFDKASLSDSDIDYYILHQANYFILEALRKKMKISVSKFPVYIEETGNTVSSTIPLVLINLIKMNCFNVNKKLVFIGFGVGYSWGACVVNFSGGFFNE
jgi:3-oxoacyl-[acyl-carrier-protein] synthase-3